MENEKAFRLEREPVGKLLFSLALPSVISQLVMAIYNIVDRIFIGHIPGVGAAALTGVGIAGPAIMLVVAFANLIGMGSASRAAIHMGKGEKEHSEKIVGNAFIMVIITAILLTIAFLIFKVPLLKAFGAGPESLSYAVEYSTIYMLGTVFVLLSSVLNMFIATQGFTGTSMFIVSSGAIINIGLDGLFIFGLNMGVKGAAAATVISQAVSGILAVKFLRGKKTLIKIKKENFKLDKNIIKPCLALGTAPFVMMATESILLICFNSSLVRYGGEMAVGAMTIAGSIMQCGLLIITGITQGGQPIISYNFGANRIDRVKKAVKLQTASCFTWSTLVWIFVMIFPQIAVGIFTGDPKLLDLSRWAVRIYGAGMLMLGIQISCQQAFIALGNAKTSTFLAFFRKLIMLIPLIYILPHIFEDKVMAVFLAEPISDITAAMVTFIMFVMQFKKIYRKFENEQTVKL